MNGLKVVRRVLLVLILLLLCWVGAVATDFFRMQNGKEPLFCIGTGLHDDGKTRVYWGAGYKAYYLAPDEDGRGVSVIAPFWEQVEIADGV